MAWQDLVNKDSTTLNGKELLALRLELYNAACSAESMAAQLWKAYWKSLGLPARPMTKEQASLVQPIKPVKEPRPTKQSSVTVTFG